MTRNSARTAAEEWRAKGEGATKGWADTGARSYPMPKKTTEIRPTIPDAPDTGLSVGALVQHEEYGIGTITDLSGFGALRRLKIRFPSHGEKTFVADKVKLRVVGRNKA